MIYINSYGGFIDELLAIHDTIGMLRCRVSTVCIGKAMSASAVLLMSGAKGFRFITPNARVLIHQLQGGTFGNLSEMENNISEFKRQQSVIKELILQYSAIKNHELERILEKDSYFSAQEAVELGIADEIIATNSSFYKRLKL